MKCVHLHSWKMEITMKSLDWNEWELDEVIPSRLEGGSEDEWSPGMGSFSRTLATNESS
jgi:hypothetical protein